MTRKPDDPCAPDLETAIHALSDADWYRLRQAGRIIALKVPSLDGESLLFDAFERTLSGHRRWNQAAVDFVGHLIGAMRSIASHEGARKGQRMVALTSSVELIGLENPEVALAAEEQIRHLRRYFGERADTSALQVLDAMELGCDGPMIRAQLALSQTQLETILRRIRRAATRVLPG